MLLECRWSITHCLLTLSLISLTLVWLIWVPAVWTIKIFALLSTVFYGLHVLKKNVFLLSDHAIRMLRQEKDGFWYLSSNKQTYCAVLRNDSLMTAWVLVLRFDVDKRQPITLVIFPDTLLPGGYHQLLFSLRR